MAKKSIEEVQQSAPVDTSSFKTVALVSSAIVTSLPAFLYVTIHSMSLADNSFLIGALSLISFVAIYLSSNNLFNDTFNTVVYNIKKNDVTVNLKRAGMTQLEADSMKITNGQSEAGAWALFVVNSLFTILFGFFFNYVFNALETEQKYVLAMVLASATTYYLASLKYSA